jgi:hypothetical protein
MLIISILQCEIHIIHIEEIEEIEEIEDEYNNNIKIFFDII